MGAVVGLLFAIATGLLLLPPRLAPERSAGLDRLLRLSMAMGLGVGVHASGFFLSLLLFDGSATGSAVIDVFLVLLAAVVRLAANRLSDGRPVVSVRPPSSALHRVLSGVLAVLLLVSTIAFVFASIEEPHGGWDAWAIWNLRARFLARAGADWPMAFSPAMQHTDYPLLVPAAIARLWRYGSGETQLVPIGLAFLFAASTIALLCGALASLRSNGQALLAGVCLAPILLNEAAFQYADVEVGFYLLLSLVLLAWHDRVGRTDRHLVALAGLAAAMAAWTKNEGTLLLLAIAAGRVFAPKHDRAWPWPFLAGAAPILAALAYFKLSLAPSNDLLPHLDWRALLQPERYRELAGAVAKVLSGSAGLIAAALLPLFACVFLLGRSTRREAPILPYFGTLAVSLIGLFVLYVVAPRPLDWLVANSIDRLALQLYPTVLFVAFLFAATPEECLAGGVGVPSDTTA